MRFTHAFASIDVAIAAFEYWKGWHARQGGTSTSHAEILSALRAINRASFESSANAPGIGHVAVTVSYEDEHSSGRAGFYAVGKMLKIAPLYIFDRAMTDDESAKGPW